MDEATVYEFDWDTAKALSNRRKHGVAFDDAATIFLDALASGRVRVRIISGPKSDKA